MYNITVADEETRGKTKEARLNIRLREDQHELLRRAADAAGQNLSSYVLTRVLDDAYDDLADQRLFVLDSAHWTEFTARVSAPAVYRPELDKLLSRATPWTSPAIASTWSPEQADGQLSLLGDQVTAPPGSGVGALLDDVLMRLVMLRAATKELPSLEVEPQLRERIEALWQTEDGPRIMERILREAVLGLFHGQTGELVEGTPEPDDGD